MAHVFFNFFLFCCCCCLFVVVFFVVFFFLGGGGVREKVNGTCLVNNRNYTCNFTCMSHIRIDNIYIYILTCIYHQKSATTDTGTRRVSRGYAADGSYPCLHRKTFGCSRVAVTNMHRYRQREQTSDRPRTGRPKRNLPMGTGTCV